jgi:hypothetical protein
MSYVASKGDKEFETATGAVAAKSHKIRITLTSKNVKNLEKGTLAFMLPSCQGSSRIWQGVTLF